MTTDPGPQPARTLVRDPVNLGNVVLFNRLTLVFGLLTAAMVILGILTVRAGITPTTILTAGTNNKVIALSAALIWIFLGVVLAYRSQRPMHRIAGLVVQAVLAIIAAFAAIEFIMSVGGSHFFVETLLVEWGKTIVGPASNPISPVAAGLAALASFALLLAIQEPGTGQKSSSVPDAVCLLGGLISIVSFTFVISYVYGNPLLYGTQYIPIAFSSALAALCTGIALVFSAGTGAFPLRYFVESSTRAGLLRVFVPLVVAIVLMENIVIVSLSSWVSVRDAILLSSILVVFALATVLVVVRVSGRMGNALDRAEQELARKNEDLNAMNEELNSTQEDLVRKNEDLNTLNEELTATQEELRQNVDDLSRNEEVLRESEDRFRTLADNIPQLCWMADPDGSIFWYNRRWYEYTGTIPAEMEGWGWQAVHDPDELPRVLAEWRSSIATGKPFDMVFPLRRADGLFRPFLTRVMPVFGPENRIARWFGTNTDITEQKKSEETLQRKNEEFSALNEELTATQEELHQHIDDLGRSEEILRQNEETLKATLAEKEILLSEIHHRVKNNLTAFISLLSLEGSVEDTPAGLELKKDLQNRARSMALIHETLYKTHQFSEVDMDSYLTPLVHQIVNSYSSPQSIRTIIEAKGVALDLARATPAGLIINELVTNSLKHGFPKEAIACRADQKVPWTIGVRLTRENGSFLLSVYDNGVGMPAGFDPLTAKSLGLKLVTFLAKHQMRAQLEVNSGNGTAFEFRFRE